MLPRFGPNERPEFIYLKIFDAVRQARFGDLSRLVPNDLQDRVWTDPQDTCNVADAGTVEGHWNTQIADSFSTTIAGVTGNELPPAIFAAIALFLIGSFAILLDVQ